MTGFAHPIGSIWTRPRSTIRQVVANDPEYGVFLLTVLAGILAASLEVTGRLVETDVPPALVVALVLVAGPVQGFFVLYLGGWLLMLTGRWLGGRAPSVDVRAALAWSNVPLIAGFAGGWVLVGVERVLAPGGPFVFLVAAVFAVSLVWSYALLAACLAAVQRFSLWKSALSMALVGALLWLVPLLGGLGFAAALEGFLGTPAAG